MIHGHAHPTVEASMFDAISRGTGVTAVMPEQIELGQLICERVPGVERVRFCNSGTEAVMFAVRTARAHKLRDKIIKMEGGYHGTTDMMEFNISPPSPADGKTYNAECIPECDGISKKSGEDLLIAPFNNLEVVENILKEQASEIAGILVEPVMGVAGFITPNPGYLEGLRELADKYDVLLIFDEVQTLRLSTGGAQKKYGVTPDITAMAKIIGGGLPVGAFGGKKDLMAVYDTQRGKFLSQSGTFNGCRAVMAAGITTLKLFDEDAVKHLDEMSDKLADSIRDSIKKHEIPASLAHAGSFLQIHYTTETPENYAATITPYKHLGKLFHLELLKRGIYVAPRGTIALSTVMTEDDIAIAAKAIDEALLEIKPFF